MRMNRSIPLPRPVETTGEEYDPWDASEPPTSSSLTQARSICAQAGGKGLQFYYAGSGSGRVSNFFYNVRFVPRYPETISSRGR